MFPWESLNAVDPVRPVLPVQPPGQKPKGSEQGKKPVEDGDDDEKFEDYLPK